MIAGTFTKRDVHVTVMGEGLSAVWNGQDFIGDPAVVHAARTAAEIGEEVEIFGMFPVTASNDESIGALAALFAYKPGRTVVPAGPVEVMNWLDEAFGADTGSHAGAA